MSSVVELSPHAVRLLGDQPCSNYINIRYIHQNLPMFRNSLGKSSFSNTALYQHPMFSVELSFFFGGTVLLFRWNRSPFSVELSLFFGRGIYADTLSSRFNYHSFNFLPSFVINTIPRYVPDLHKIRQNLLDTTVNPTLQFPPFLV